jgi:hypothetical protein
MTKADCCVANPGTACAASTGARSICSSCDVRGRLVSTLTVKSLVRDHTRVPADAEFSFCRTPDCEIVYFSGDVVFRKGDLKVRVGIKEQDDPISICYCFGYSRADIRSEFAALGKTDIPDRIRTEVQNGFCACEVKNPSGKCCLGEVNHTIKELRSAKREMFVCG